MENRTLAKQAYEHLRQQILSNELQPGQRLLELELSQRLTISRAPVREALNMLAAEGMVTISPRRGARVASLDPQEFLELVQVREALESLAARLATDKIDDAELESLYEINRKMQRVAKNKEIDDFFDLNNLFHARFLEKAGNEYLRGLHARVMDHLKRYRLKTVMLRRGIGHTMKEHRAILDAVARHDADKASHLIADHIRVPLDVIEKSKEAWSKEENHMTDAGTKGGV